MATLRELIIKISANSQSFQSEISRASRMGNDYYRSMQNGGRQAAASSRETQRALSGVTSQLAETKSMAMGLAGSFAGAFATRNLIQLADSYNSISARLKLATADTTDFSIAQAGLMEISQRTGSAFANNADLFSRTSVALREWGFNTKDLLNLTDALSTSLQVSGASVEATSSAITQLSQALGRGVLRGQDFNSVAQSSPRIMKALADGLGVAQKDLKGMADAGLLPTEKIVPALISQVGKLRSEFESMPNSVSAASTRISNAFMAWVGGANQASGATASISGVLDNVAKNIDTFATAAGVLVSVGLARAVGGWSTSLTKASRDLVTTTQGQLAKAAAQREGLTVTLANINAEKQAAIAAQQSLAAQLQLAQTEKTRTVIRRQMAVQAAEIIKLTQAETAAKAQLVAVQSRLSVMTGLASKALGLVGGPMGAAMLAGGALYYFHEQAKQAKQSAIDLANAIPKLNEDLNGLSFAGLKDAKFSNESAISNSVLQINKLKKDIVDLDSRAEGLSGFDPFDQLKGVLADRAKAVYDLEKATNGLTLAQERQVAITSMLSTVTERASTVSGQLNKANQSVTTDFKDFEKSVASLALQLDVSQLSANGAAREAYILAGLQKAAGDAALQHKDDLIALAKGQIVSGAISEELALKLTDYAAKLGKLFDDNTQSKSLKSTQKAADGVAQSYQRQLDTLNQQIALFGQTTELAKQRYQLTQGELKGLDSSKKAALEQRATELDRLNSMKAYQDTMSDLQTAEEKALTTTKERLKTIRDAKLSSDELAAAVEKASKASVTKPPEFGGLSPEVGGAAGEMINIAKAEVELQKWHDKQIEMQNTLFVEEEINADQHAARLAEIEEASAQRRGEINSAYAAAALGTISSMTGQMADMMSQMGDKNSAAYKAMFLTSKAAAIAQAMISTEVAATKALEMGTILGIPAVALVRGLGYASIGMIAGQTLAGMAHDGIDSVPREGTWLLDRGERVVDARTNSDLKSFLNNSSGGGGSNINITVPVSVGGGIGAEDAKALSGLIKGKVMEVITNERRSGGLLNKG